MTAKASTIPPFMIVLLATIVLLIGVSLIDDGLFWNAENSNNKSTLGRSESLSNSSDHRLGTTIAKAAREEGKNYVESVQTADGDAATIRPEHQQKQSETDDSSTEEPIQGDFLISIVVNLQGNDLGTWLAKIAFARILQLDVNNKFNIKTTFNPLVTEDSREMMVCFPNVDMNRSWNLEQFEARKHQQVELYGNTDVLLKPSNVMFDDNLALLLEKLKNNFTTLGSISPPFLLADQAIGIDEIRYMTQVKEMMEMLESCCTEFPITTETVLFLDGLNDMTPNQTIALLGDTKVVIVTARPNIDVTAYSSTLLQARVVADMTPMSKYCLLRFAEKEIVGPIQSHFLQWAAIFNSKAKRRMYTTKTAFIKKQVFQNEGDPRKSIAFEVIDLLSGIQNTTNEECDEANTTQRNTTINLNLIPLLPTLGTDEHPVSLVIQLSGEMGNQLSKIAWGYGMKWWLEEDYNITTKIFLRHQDHGKWIGAAASIKRCFTKLRVMDFEEANSMEFDAIREQQNTWVGKDKQALLSPRGSEFESKEWITKSLQTLKDAMEAPDRPAPPANSNFTLPLLYTDTFGNIGDVNDRYFERLKHLYQFETDNPICCNTKAEPDETVFHLRNFLVEMKKAWRLGFEETSANKTAYELFAHLNAGDKVAITSRFSNHGVQEYVEKFNERGIIVRVISDQSAEQDFCFLMSTTKEMVGMAMSTYAIWAGYLGNASSVRLYTVESSFRKARYGESWHFSFNYSNPDLQRRYSFPGIKSELQETEDSNTRNASLRIRI